MDTGRTGYDSGLPPYLAVAGDLRRRIQAGEWAGRNLPQGRELAQQYSVSRNTIIRALKVLREEGTIAGKRGWGSWPLSRGRDG